MTKPKVIALGDFTKNRKKTIDVFVLVNTLTSVNQFIYHNHVQFFVRTAKELPHVRFRFFAPSRMAIDQARNTAAKLALQYGCQYLMFIDDDVMIPPNTMDLLLKADKDIVAGLVIIRGYPFNVMAFKFEKKLKKGNRTLNFYNKLPKLENGKLQPLIPCDAIGFSCCLIKTSVLTQLTEPYFVTGTGNTEDVYFCIKAKEEVGKQLSIFMHSEVECGHMLNAEPIQWRNRKAMIRFYKKEYIEKIPNQNRGAAYINMILKDLR